MTPAGAPALEALRKWRGLSCCHIFLSDHRSAAKDAEGEDNARSWEFEVNHCAHKVSLAHQISGKNINLHNHRCCWFHPQRKVLRVLQKLPVTTWNQVENSKIDQDVALLTACEDEEYATRTIYILRVVFMKLVHRLLLASSRTHHHMSKSTYALLSL